uniref:Uncharacterized protein n=1 Tax=Manihot esculenta TaxID=3983 RepID=A0A2C9VFZ2_MANES
MRHVLGLPRAFEWSFTHDLKLEEVISLITMNFSILTLSDITALLG